MKKMFQRVSALALGSVLLFSSFSSQAQQDPSKRPSPPATVTQKLKDATVVIEYSRPSVKGREIWGKLVPYAAVWRTGANKATTFSVDKDVTVEGKALKAGKYALFTIPGEKEWTIIFSGKADQNGAFGYKQEEDVLRVNVKPSAAPMTEMFTIEVDKNGKTSLIWEKVKVDFRVKG